MDGRYGDSTRSVKAVGSEPIPGSPVAPPAGARVDISSIA